MIKNQKITEFRLSVILLAVTVVLNIVANAIVIKAATPSLVNWIIMIVTLLAIAVNVTLLLTRMFRD